MSQKIIIGIDPGIRRLGFAVLLSKGKDCKLLKSGSLEFSSKNLLHEIVAQQFSFFSFLCDSLASEYMMESIIFIVEKQFLGKNVATTLKVNTSRSVFLILCGLRKYNISELSPCEWKKIISGDPFSGKENTFIFVSAIFSYAKLKSFDESDALGIAYAGFLLFGISAA